MHDFSLATEIVSAALDAAGKADAGDVTAVYVSLDPASHLDPATLASAFEIAAAGTAAAGATLEVSLSGSGRGEIAVTAIDTSGDG